MTITAKSWLPVNAVSSERLQPLLTQTISEWGEHWFAVARPNISPVFQDEWPDAKGEAWHSCPSIASLCLTATARSALVGAMLGSNVPPGPISDGDRLIVDHLSSTCINDLLSRVALLACRPFAQEDLDDQPVDLGDCSWWEISLGAGRRALKLALAASAATRIIQHQLPVAAKPKLDALHRGLGEQRIELAVELGRCALSLSDLKDLAIGDVLVLDRSPDTPLGLLVNGSASPLRVSLEADDEKVGLILASRS